MKNFKELYDTLPKRPNEDDRVVITDFYDSGELFEIVIRKRQQKATN